jgi:acyl dehydratase
MAGPVAERRVYFEDVQMHVALKTPGMTLTETHAAMFTALTGSRPTDPGAIPDLIPLCLSSGLGWRVPQAPLVVLAFMGFEWRFLKPARVGDTIHSVSTTVAKRSMKDGGVVVEERRILNQHGDLVQSGRLTLLVAKRPAA